MTLATSLLGKSDATEQEIISAVTGASPEQLAMLKNAELEFQTEFEKARHRPRKNKHARPRQC